MGILSDSEREEKTIEALSLFSRFDSFHSRRSTRYSYSFLNLNPEGVDPRYITQHILDAYYDPRFHKFTSTNTSKRTSYVNSNGEREYLYIPSLYDFLVSGYAPEELVDLVISKASPNSKIYRAALSHPRADMDLVVKALRRARSVDALAILLTNPNLPAEIIREIYDKDICESPIKPTKDSAYDFYMRKTKIRECLKSIFGNPSTPLDILYLILKHAPRHWGWVAEEIVMSGNICREGFDKSYYKYIFTMRDIINHSFFVKTLIQDNRFANVFEDYIESSDNPDSLRDMWRSKIALNHVMTYDLRRNINYCFTNSSETVVAAFMNPNVKKYLESVECGAIHQDISFDKYSSFEDFIIRNPSSYVKMSYLLQIPETRIVSQLMSDEDEAVAREAVELMMRNLVK